MSADSHLSLLNVCYGELAIPTVIIIKVIICVDCNRGQNVVICDDATVLNIRSVLLA